MNAWLGNHIGVKKAISGAVALAFFVCFVLSDARVLAESNISFSGTSKARFANLEVDTFTIPSHLGEIKYSFKGDSDNIVIHIQDAHCNYFAQKKISEIIEYLYTEYGLHVVNLEGGVGDYNVSVFTSIADPTLRKEVAGYFVKNGEINGAELYAINNPGNVQLWGIEDEELYMENLQVYRDSLQYKERVDSWLDGLTRILNDFKRHIYGPELLKIDMAYNAYKSGNMAFRDYLTFLIRTARESNIPIEEFSNLHMLSETLEMEDRVDFEKADGERNILIDELKDRMSAKEIKELISKSVEFKTKKISRNAFYGYLLRKARTRGIDLERFPSLSDYIAYVTIYESVDRYRVMEEVAKLETEIKELLYKNDTQRELDVLSRNLTLLKNIFDISLIRTDYMYYLEDPDAFSMSGYIRFIDREGSKYRITARPEEDILELDAFLDRIMKFYDYSFKRDEVFIRNMKFRSISGGTKGAILMTGGFHTENLHKLFRENGISYVSIFPKFTSEKDYKNSYFDLLAGRSNGVQNMIRPVVAEAAMLQIASKLSSLGKRAYDPGEVFLFNAAVTLLAKLMARDDWQDITDHIDDMEITEENGFVTCNLNGQELLKMSSVDLFGEERPAIVAKAPEKVVVKEQRTTDTGIDEVRVEIDKKVLISNLSGQWKAFSKDDRALMEQLLESLEIYAPVNRVPSDFFRSPSYAIIENLFSTLSETGEVRILHIMRQMFPDHYNEEMLGDLNIRYHIVVSHLGKGVHREVDRIEVEGTDLEGERFDESFTASKLQTRDVKEMDRTINEDMTIEMIQEMDRYADVRKYFQKSYDIYVDRENNDAIIYKSYAPGTNMRTLIMNLVYDQRGDHGKHMETAEKTLVELGTFYGSFYRNIEGEFPSDPKLDNVIALIEDGEVRSLKHIDLEAGIYKIDTKIGPSGMAGVSVLNLARICSRLGQRVFSMAQFNEEDDAWKNPAPFSFRDLIRPREFVQLTSAYLTAFHVAEKGISEDRIKELSHDFQRHLSNNPPGTLSGIMLAAEEFFSEVEEQAPPGIGKGTIPLIKAALRPVFGLFGVRGADYDDMYDYSFGPRFEELIFTAGGLSLALYLNSPFMILIAGITFVLLHQVVFFGGSFMDNMRTRAKALKAPFFITLAISIVQLCVSLPALQSATIVWQLIGIFTIWVLTSKIHADVNRLEDELTPRAYASVKLFADMIFMPLIFIALNVGILNYGVKAPEPTVQPDKRPDVTMKAEIDGADWEASAPDWIRGPAAGAGIHAGFGIAMKGGAWDSDTAIEARRKGLQNQVDNDITPEGFSKKTVMVSKVIDGEEKEVETQIIIHNSILEKLRAEGISLQSFVDSCIAIRGPTYEETLRTRLAGKPLIIDMPEKSPNLFGDCQDNGYIYINSNAPVESWGIGVSHELMHEAGIFDDSNASEEELAKQDMQIMKNKGIDINDILHEIEETSGDIVEKTEVFKNAEIGTLFMDVDATDPIKSATEDYSVYPFQKVWRHYPKSHVPMTHVQGWKLHVAATVENAGAILKLVLPILEKHNVPHKVANGIRGLTRLNESGGTQVGKFIAIYTRSKEEAEILAKELDLALRDRGFLAPPGILWDEEGSKGDKLTKGGRSGLVGYRYGSYTDYKVELPDGQIVPDDRERYKHPDVMQTMRNINDVVEVDALSRKEQLKRWRDQLRRGDFRNFAAIGDVHGDMDRLKALIDGLEADGVENFVFAGDYMDRGEQNLQVIKYVRKLKEDGQAKLVMGNHDMWFIQAMMGDSQTFVLWVANGGYQVLAEAGIDVSDLQVRAERAVRIRTNPAVEIFDYFQENPARAKELFSAARSNKELQETGDWLHKNLDIFYVNEQSILFVHAGIPLDGDGNVALEYKGKRGLDALKAMQDDFKKASSYDDPIFRALNSSSSPVLVRKGWADVVGKPGVSDNVLDQLGVNGVVFGHTPQRDLLNANSENKIFGIDLGMSRGMRYGDRGGNLLFGRAGLVLNRRTEKGDIAKEEVAGREKLIRELDERIARLEDKEELDITQVELPSDEVSMAISSRRSVYDDFIEGLNDTEKRLIAAMVAAFETHDPEKARIFLVDETPGMVDRYMMPVIVDRYLSIRAGDINLFRLVRAQLMAGFTADKQPIIDASRSLRGKIADLSERLIVVDSDTGVRTISTVRRKILLPFIESLTPEEKKFIVSMSIASKSPSLGKSVMAQQKTIEQMSMEIIPEVVDNYLRMRGEDIEQFRNLRHVILSGIMTRDGYRTLINRLKVKTDALDVEIKEVEAEEAGKRETEDVKDGLDRDERKLIIAMGIALDGRYDEAVEVIINAGEIPSVEPEAAAKYLKSRERNVQSFRAVRTEVLRRLKDRSSGAVKVYFGNDDSSVMNRLKLRKEKAVEDIAKKAEGARSEEMIKEGLSSDERKLILAMLSALDGKINEAMAMIISSDESPGITPLAAKKYQDARGDMDTFRRARNDLIKRLQGDFGDVVAKYFGNDPSSVMNRLKLEKGKILGSIAQRTKPAKEAVPEKKPAAVPKNAILAYLNELRNKNDAANFHRTIKLIAASINNDPGILQQRGSLSAEKIADTIQRIDEFNGKNASEIINISGREADYGPVMAVLEELSAIKAPEVSAGEEVYTDPAKLENDIAQREAKIGDMGLETLPKISLHGELAGHEPTGEIYYFAIDLKDEQLWPEVMADPKRETELQIAIGFKEKTLKEVIMGRDEFLERLYGTVIAVSDYGGLSLSEGTLPEIYLLRDVPDVNLKFEGVDKGKKDATWSAYNPITGRVEDFRLIFIEGQKAVAKIHMDKAVAAKIGLSADEIYWINRWQGENGKSIQEAEGFAKRLLYKKVLDKMIEMAEPSAVTAPAAGSWRAGIDWIQKAFLIEAGIPLGLAAVFMFFAPQFFVPIIAAMLFAVPHLRYDSDNNKIYLAKQTSWPVVAGLAVATGVVSGLTLLNPLIGITGIVVLMLVHRRINRNYLGSAGDEISKLETNMRKVRDMLDAVDRYISEEKRSLGDNEVEVVQKVFRNITSSINEVNKIIEKGPELSPVATEIIKKAVSDYDSEYIDITNRFSDLNIKGRSLDRISNQVATKTASVEDQAREDLGQARRDEYFKEYLRNRETFVARENRQPDSAFEVVSYAETMYEISFKGQLEDSDKELVDKFTAGTLDREEAQNFARVLTSGDNRLYYNSEGELVNLEEYLKDYYSALGTDIQVERIVFKEMPIGMRKDILRMAVGQTQLAKNARYMESEITGAIEEVLDGKAALEEIEKYYPDVISSLRHLIVGNMQVPHIIVRRADEVQEVPIISLSFNPGSRKDGNAGFAAPLVDADTSKAVGRQIFINTVPGNTYRQLADCVATIIHEVDHAVSDVVQKDLRSRLAVNLNTLKEEQASLKVDWGLGIVKVVKTWIRDFILDLKIESLKRDLVKQEKKHSREIERELYLEEGRADETSRKFFDFQAGKLPYLTFLRLDARMVNEVRMLESEGGRSEYIIGETIAQAFREKFGEDEYFNMFYRTKTEDLPSVADFDGLRKNVRSMMLSELEANKDIRDLAESQARLQAPVAIVPEKPEKAATLRSGEGYEVKVVRFKSERGPETDMAIATYATGQVIVIPAFQDMYKIWGMLWDKVPMHFVYQKKEGDPIQDVVGKDLRKDLWTIEEHLEEFKRTHPDLEIVAYVGNGNVLANDYLVGYVGDKLYGVEREKELIRAGKSRNYPSVIMWDDENFTITIEEVAFTADEKPVRVSTGEKLTGKVLAINSGVGLLKKDVPYDLAENYEHDYDIRHYLDFPFINTGKITFGMSQFRENGVAKEDMMKKALAGEEGKPVPLTLTEGGVDLTDEQINDLENNLRYEKKYNQGKEPASPGEVTYGTFYLDRDAGKITIGLKRGIHPHNILGIDKDGNLVSIVVAGLSSRVGITYKEAQDKLKEMGITDAIVFDNGADAMMNVNGEYIVPSFEGRDRFLSIFIIARPRSGSAEGIVIDADVEGVLAPREVPAVELEPPTGLDAIRARSQQMAEAAIDEASREIMGIAEMEEALAVLDAGPVAGEDFIGRPAESKEVKTIKNATEVVAEVAGALAAERENIINIEEADVMAVVLLNDEERTKDLKGVGSIQMTGVKNAAQRLVSRKQNAKIVYVRTMEEAMAKLDPKAGRTASNTFFFIEKNRLDETEKASYEDLKREAFIWNLNIPDGSICSVTPLGFLMFSLKFNDMLGRMERGEGDLDMRPLAKIMLINMGEEASEENIDEVINSVLEPISKSGDITAALELSGKFTWNLPKIAPENWSQVDEHFNAMRQVYRAL